MTVTVLLFAAAKEAAGTGRMEITMPDNATVADVKRHICDRFPTVRSMLETAMWSINSEYARLDDPVSDRAEIGVILPVSGG